LTGTQPTVTVQSSSGTVTLNTDRPSYNISPSELSKTFFTKNNVKFVKYVFHELQTQKNELPYNDTKEPTGNVRIEITIKESDSEYFETYLYDKEIVVIITTSLIAENEINTFSSFNIDQGAVTGYFIERGKGTELEEKQEGSKKRIPANKYEVVKYDCEKYPRPNCPIEFQIVTTLEKSGTRSGILIHNGWDYQHTTGCLITVGDSYSIEMKDFEIGGEIKSLAIYNSGGSSNTKLVEINKYVNAKKEIANTFNKKLKIIIEINR